MGSLVIKEITNISSEGFFKRKISISFILSDSIKLDLRLFVFFFIIIIHTGKSIEKMMETIQSIFLQLDRPTDSRLKHRQEKADCQTGKTGSNYTVTAEV